MKNKPDRKTIFLGQNIMIEEDDKGLHHVHLPSDEEVIFDPRKTYHTDFWNPNHLFSYPWAHYYIVAGPKGTGKSYSIVEWAIKQKLKLKENLKIYWFRLSETSIQTMLADNAKKTIDPDLVRKYNLDLKRKNNELYFGQEDGTDLKFAEFIDLATFAKKAKGVQYYDNQYRGKYIIILDEFKRESSEKRMFDVATQFSSTLEAVIRKDTKKASIFMIGNDAREASEIAASFNFIAEKPGLYKIHKKNLLVEFIQPNDHYYISLDGTYQAVTGLQGDFGHAMEDLSGMLVSRRRCIHPQKIIKFRKDPNHWFTMWDNNIITLYHGESCPSWEMRPNLGGMFFTDIRDAVKNLFFTNSFSYTAPSVMMKFTQEMEYFFPKM